jgi:hypothetical protein
MGSKVIMVNKMASVVSVIRISDFTSKRNFGKYCSAFLGIEYCVMRIGYCEAGNVNSTICISDVEDDNCT